MILLFVNEIRSLSFLIAHIAQPVEHFLGKEEVTSSSLVVGSSFYRKEPGVSRVIFFCIEQLVKVKEVS